MALLSPEALQKIERELAKYPPEQKQSAVMSALGIAQDEHGWLSSELMEEVAKVLGMPPVWVYEVATFYNMYNLKPLGRFRVVICTNLPCALSGAEEAAKPLKHRLGLEESNQTSAIGPVTLNKGAPFAACRHPPTII